MRDSSLQDLLNNVLDCLNEIICSRDKSMSNVVVDLIQCTCDMCGCIWKFGGNLDCSYHRAMDSIGHAKVHMTISADLYNFLTKPSDMFKTSP